MAPEQEARPQSPDHQAPVHAPAQASRPSTVRRRRHWLIGGLVFLMIMIGLHTYVYVGKPRAVSRDAVAYPAAFTNVSVSTLFSGEQPTDTGTGTGTGDVAPGGVFLAAKVELALASLPVSDKARDCVGLLVVHIAALTIGSATIPATPPAWSLPFVHAIGVLAVAGRAKSVWERFDDVAYMEEHPATMAVRRAALVLSFLGALGRALAASHNHGASFWTANRALAVYNGLLLLGLIVSLWWVEGPATYPPLDNSMAEGLCLAGAMVSYACVYHPRNRRRVADAIGWQLSANVGACDGMVPKLVTPPAVLQS